jgi:hypothetical protein
MNLADSADLKKGGQMRLLKVQGKGWVATEPDLVMLSFGVESKAQEYAECIRTLKVRTDSLRASMKAAKIDRAGLKTSSFSVRAEYQYKDGQRLFDGYYRLASFPRYHSPKIQGMNQLRKMMPVGTVQPYRCIHGLGLVVRYGFSLSPSSSNPCWQT